MDFLKILRALLTGVYKLSDGEVDSLLQESENNTGETALAAILAKDRERVADLMKPKPGQTFQDGYKKAKAEVLTTLETELKEKYNLSTDATGLELVEEAINAKSGNKGAKLSDDEIKKHPIYQQLEKDLRKQLKDKDAEMETKVTELQTSFQKNQVFADVSKDGLQMLDGLKPVLPNSPTVAGTLKNKFVEEFKVFDYEKQADGKWLVMKDGQVQKNAHGHTLYLEDLVKEKAGNYFEFQQNNGGGNAGNGGANDQKNNGSQPDPNYPAGITKPKTVEDLYKIVNDTAIKAEDRQTVLRAWENEQKVG